MASAGGAAKKVRWLGLLDRVEWLAVGLLLAALGSYCLWRGVDSDFVGDWMPNIGTSLAIIAVSIVPVERVVKRNERARNLELAIPAMRRIRVLLGSIAHVVDTDHMRTHKEAKPSTDFRDHALPNLFEHWTKGLDDGDALRDYPGDSAIIRALVSLSERLAKLLQQYGWDLGDWELTGATRRFVLDVQDLLEGPEGDRALIEGWHKTGDDRVHSRVDRDLRELAPPLCALVEVFTRKDREFWRDRQLRKAMVQAERDSGGYGDPPSALKYRKERAAEIATWAVLATKRDPPTEVLRQLDEVDKELKEDLADAKKARDDLISSGVNGELLKKYGDLIAFIELQLSGVEAATPPSPTTPPTPVARLRKLCQAVLGGRWLMRAQRPNGPDSSQHK